MDKIEISEYGNLLIFKKSYSYSYVNKIIQQEKLNGLRIFFPFKSDSLTDFDFLKEYDFLEALEISVTSGEYDFSFLSHLVNLKKLSINVIGQNEIDLSGLKKLEDCTLLWRKKIVGLNNCTTLKKLCLIDFKQDDLSKISELINLNKLVIKTSSIQTLKGIENLKNVEQIMLGNCKKLKSIVDLNGLLKLKSLEFNICSSIYDFSDMRELPSLEFLQLVDCKDIASLKFLLNLKSLNKFYILGNTTILDKDFSYTNQINEVSPDIKDIRR